MARDALAASRTARLRPFLFVLLAIGLLTGMDVLIKIVSPRYATVQVAAFRFLFGSLVILIVWAFLRPGRPSLETVKANGLRGLVVVATSLTFFYALRTLPLAEAVALSFLSPLFLSLLGVLILKEAIAPRSLQGLFLGFGGMLIMTFGSGLGGAPLPLAGVAAAMGAAAFYALSLVLLRQRATRDPAVTIVAMQNIVPALLLLPVSAFVFVPPDAFDLLIFLGIGLLGAGGHLLMAKGFSEAEASKLAPMDYTALVFAALFGYLFFGEVPGPFTLAGALLIVVAAIIAGRR